MFLKKIVCLMLCMLFVLGLAACGGNASPTIDASNAVDSGDKPQKEEEEAPPPDPYANCVINPLTGEKTLDPEAEGNRPVAVSINNIYAAQAVQSGLDKADVIFESEVEGGITRLLALFTDPSDVGKIGTIRSLRVPFAEIARGMNAILYFHGMDNTYCRPLLPTLGLSYAQIDAAKYGFREKNGLSYEHTLYSSGDRIMKLTEARGFKTKGSGENWLNFSDAEEKLVPASGTAKTAKVKFNGTSTTNFFYDTETEKYTRANKNGTEFKTYHTGQKEQFTNVFVLKTSIYDYPDGKHRAIDLSSGSGWYISAGGYTEINWKKGAASENFSFTATDGTPLTVNKGNSYVCIMNHSGTLTME